MQGRGKIRGEYDVCGGRWPFTVWEAVLFLHDWSSDSGFAAIQSEFQEGSLLQSRSLELRWQHMVTLLPRGPFLKPLHGPRGMLKHLILFSACYQPIHASTQPFIYPSIQPPTNAPTHPPIYPFTTHLPSNSHTHPRTYPFYVHALPTPYSPPLLPIPSSCLPTHPSPCLHSSAQSSLTAPTQLFSHTNAETSLVNFPVDSGPPRGPSQGAQIFKEDNPGDHGALGG